MTKAEDPIICLEQRINLKTSMMVMKTWTKSETTAPVSIGSAVPVVIPAFLSPAMGSGVTAAEPFGVPSVPGARHA